MPIELEYEDSNYEPIAEDDGGMSCLEITTPDEHELAWREAV